MLDKKPQIELHHRHKVDTVTTGNSREAGGPLMRVLASLFLLLPVLVMTGCVTDNSAVQAELNSIKHNTIQNRNKLALLKQDMQGLKQSTGGVLANDEVIEAIRTSQTSLYTQVSSMTGELQTTSARLDEIQYEVRKALENMGAEIDLFKSKVEEGAGGAGGVAGQEADKLRSETISRLDALEGSIGILKTQIAALSTAATGGVSKKSVPETMYKGAYSLYEKRRFTEAREEMRLFLAEYPRHELAGNAMFWIGETHFHQKRYDSAILAYQDVIEKYPENRKVPAAHLKQAFAFISLGEKVAARGILKTLLDRYPKSDVAASAKAKLKEIK